jgi:hypothetical protein
MEVSVGLNCLEWPFGLASIIKVNRNLSSFRNYTTPKKFFVGFIELRKLQSLQTVVTSVSDSHGALSYGRSRYRDSGKMASFDSYVLGPQPGSISTSPLPLFLKSSLSMGW